MEKGSIWNNGNNYPQYNIPSITETGNSSSNSGITHILDPTKYLTSDDSGFVQGFWNDLMGFTSQNREFAQQEYLMDKQNAYNDPSAQMERLGKAGINLNLASSGVAQGGNESAQAPAVSSNTSGVAQGLGSAASLIGGIPSAALAMAQKRQADSQANLFDVQGIEISALLDFKKNQYAAETAKTWIDAGMDSHMANYWSIKAAYADRQERLDIIEKFTAISKANDEIQILKDNHEILVEELKLKKEQVSQSEYLTEQMRIDTELKRGIESIYKAYGVDITLPRDGMLVEAWNSGTADTILAALQSGDYVSARAAYDARVDTIVDETRGRVSEEFKGRLQELEKSEEIQKELSKYGIKGDMTKRVFDLITKYLFGVGMSVNVRGVGVSNSDAK